MKDNAPSFYHHFTQKDGERAPLRQDANRVRAQSRKAYKANPTLAKFTNALWAEKNPELRRLSSSLWWQRNKHRPEVQEANRLKARRLSARKKVYRIVKART